MSGPQPENGFGSRLRSLHQGRVMLGLFAVLLIGLGLYAVADGGGFFTYRTIGDGSYTLHYPVVLRQQSDSLFTVTIAQPKVGAVLHFDTPFNEHFTITKMTPQPTAAFDTSWGRAYRFALADEGPGRVQVSIASLAGGRVNYSIMTNGRVAMLTTVVLP